MVNNFRSFLRNITLDLNTFGKPKQPADNNISKWFILKLGFRVTFLHIQDMYLPPPISRFYAVLGLWNFKKNIYVFHMFWVFPTWSPPWYKYALATFFLLHPIIVFSTCAEFIKTVFFPQSQKHSVAARRCVKSVMLHLLFCPRQNQVMNTRWAHRRRYWLFQVAMGKPVPYLLSFWYWLPKSLNS